MSIDEFPRVLVISHNCFSSSDSNGRTLGNFFLKWPSHCVAQFYIYDEIPDLNICSSYYRVTDREALRAFLKGNKGGKKINAANQVSQKQKVNMTSDKEITMSRDKKVNILEKKEINRSSNKEINRSSSKNINAYQGRKIRRNPWTCIAREIVWKSNRWKGSDFESWIDEFNPEVVLLQAGDTAFLCKIALEVAKERKIPLVIYNSESYYFKEKNYMAGSGLSALLYPIFINYFRKQFDKTIAYASHSIYICRLLQEVYDKKFHRPSSVIMTSTEIIPRLDKRDNEIPLISYLGNLVLGRHEPLIEIAEALQDINSNYYLDVYGKVPDEAIAAAFKQCRGINYKGVVPYNKVLEIMHKSDLLIHVESFSEFYKRDTKYGFSTKIADSLGSGTCFLIYAPRDIACTEYLLKKKAAVVVTSKDSLKEALEKTISQKEVRQLYIANALKAVEENHNWERNGEKFRRLICGVVKFK